jgi:ElaB/YqjD/DUF883 family membrane-anchored ribosome-binding protein
MRSTLSLTGMGVAETHSAKGDNMDSTSTWTPSRAYEADIAAATAHLKESWECGKEAALDARRIARTRLHDLSHGIDQYIESRPRTIVFLALGTGLAVGFLLSFIVRRAVRASSATA